MEQSKIEVLNVPLNEPDLKAQEQSRTSSIAEAAKADATPAELNKVELQSVLSEARATKLMLEEFDTAVKNGTYSGHQMIAIAKGLSFLHALISQSKGHIESLQTKLEASKQEAR